MVKDFKVDIKINSMPFYKGLMTILRGLYQLENSPYGDTEEGFNKWLLERKQETETNND